MTDILPPRLTAIHADTGQGFRLDDEGFSRWWAATVLPEDAQEFVHLLGGTIDEARYVCAIDYLTNVLGEQAGADTTVKAYFLAKNETIDLKDSHARTNAHYLSQSDATTFLLDRVRLRNRRIAEERIAGRTTAKLEELFERSRLLEGREQLETEKAALDGSLKFLANQARERGQEQDKRAKKAIQTAMERSRHTEYDVSRPPSPAEAKLHLSMLIDTLGPEIVADLVRELTPLGLPDAPRS